MIILGATVQNLGSADAFEARGLKRVPESANNSWLCWEWEIYPPSQNIPITISSGITFQNEESHEIIRYEGDIPANDALITLCQLMSSLVSDSLPTYDVAISYRVGEGGGFALELQRILENAEGGERLEVYCDDVTNKRLSGYDLKRHLERIFGGDSRLVTSILTPRYSESEHCKLEHSLADNRRLNAFAVASARLHVTEEKLRNLSLTKDGSFYYKPYQHGLELKKDPTLREISTGVPPFETQAVSAELKRQIGNLRSMPIFYADGYLPRPDLHGGMIDRFESPILQIVGPGGSGKSRLATFVATALSEFVIGGIWFFPLDEYELPVSAESNQAIEIENRSRLVSQIVRAMGLPTSKDKPELDVLKGALREMNTILILDNAESASRLVEWLAGELLQNGGKLRLIVTSIVALNLPGQPLEVTGILPFGSASAQVQVGALDLFGARAQRAVESSEREIALKIIQNVEALPLAIELVSRWSDDLAEIERVTSENATAIDQHNYPKRRKTQETMSVTIRHTLDLHEESNVQVLQMLCLLPGGFTDHCAFHITKQPGETLETFRERLDRLANSYLVRKGADSRYRMREPVRQYLRNRLTESESNFGTVLGKLVAYFRRMSQRMSKASFTGDQDRMIPIIDPEWVNFVALANILAEQGDPRQRGLKMICELFLHIEVRENYSMAIPLIMRLRSLGGTRTRLWVEASRMLGEQLRWSGRLDEGISEVSKAIEVAKQIGDDHGLCSSLLTRSMIYWDQNRIDLQKKDNKEALRIAKGLPDKGYLAGTLAVLSYQQYQEGNFKQSLQTSKAPTKWYRHEMDRSGLVDRLNNDALCYIEMEEFNKAEQSIDEGLKLARKFKGEDKSWVRILLWNLGYCKMRRDDYQRAFELFEAVIAESPDQSKPDVDHSSLDYYAVLAAKKGDWYLVGLLRGAALGYRKTNGVISVSWEDKVYEVCRGPLPEGAALKEYLAGLGESQEIGWRLSFEKSLILLRKLYE